MCFGGLPMTAKPYRYVSTYTSSIPQTKYHIRKDMIDNYHFWNIDDEGNIVDASPEPIGPNPSMIEDKRVYIPWSSEEQEKLLSRIMSVVSEEELEDYAEDYYEEPQFQECFKNSWSVRKIKGYRMVCGSMGYVIGNEPSYKVVSLDWGF